MATRAQINRIAFTSLGLGMCFFLLASLVSFNVYDWPNPDVAPPQAIRNLCGPVGAYLAYQCNYYLGPATIPLLMALALWLVFYCMQKPIDQLILRAIGVVLIGAVISIASYLLNPGDAQSLSQGYGGVLGIALGHFLLTQTALTGSILILAATMAVGLLLAADNLILSLAPSLLRTAQPLGHLAALLAKLPSRACSLLSSRKQALSASPGSALDATNMQRQVSSDNLDEQQSSGEFLSAHSSANADADAAAASGRSASGGSHSSLLHAVSSALSQTLGRPGEPATSSETVDEDFSTYQYPPLDLLAEPERGYSALQEKVVTQKGRVLEKTLKEFNLDAKVIEAETGPVITMFELELAPGIKVAQISNLANDLARSLGAAAVRVVAPIPGKHTIGIEVPNSEKEKVRIKELLQLAGDKPAKMHIPLFLGKDASGEPLLVDLTDLPHLLIAGTTGSGKSVCINSIITSILLTQRPDLVKLILVDPKMVEMNIFRDVPPLMCPIVTEMKRAEQILEWLTVKMDERYALLAEGRVRNIVAYNQLTPEQIYERFCPSCDEEKAKIPLRLPYLVVVIDELADLMMTSAKEVEAYIIRIAQKSRAVGIHIVLATQRPQATVVTGLIKSNLPSRISFRVAARMDSRIVLDQNGAEALLGRGDMLFLQPGTSDLVRAQGTFVGDDEIHRIVKFLKEVARPQYHPELIQLNHLDGGDLEKDDLFDQAVQIVLETKRGSVSLLQRRLTIGYSRASRLIDQMALAGIVGEYKGSQAREVLITPDEYQIIKRQMEQDGREGYRDLQDGEDTEPIPSPGTPSPSSQMTTNPTPTTKIITSRTSNWKKPTNNNKTFLFFELSPFQPSVGRPLQLPRQSALTHNSLTAYTPHRPAHLDLPPQQVQAKKCASSQTPPDVNKKRSIRVFPLDFLSISYTLSH